MDLVNDFAFKIATANGTGSASANGLHHAGHLPDGHPGHGQERLPVEHPGPAHVVRDPRQQGRLHRAHAAFRPGGGASTPPPTPRTWPRCAAAAGCSTTRRWPLDDQLTRPDVTYIGVPFADLCDGGLQGRARAHPDEEHRLRRRAGGPARHRHRGHPRRSRRRSSPRSRRCSTRTTRRSPSATTTPRTTSPARCRSISSGWTRPRTRSSSTATRPPGSAACSPAPR